VDKWPFKMQGQWFFEVGHGGEIFQSGPENLNFFMGVAHARIYLPIIARRGEV
jgi:hypothetical protein